MKLFRIMKKTTLVTLGLSLLVAVSVAWRADDGRYKNLKILPKDITEKQLDSVMHHFNVALGVKCNFCHVRNESTNKLEFASDENKHKLVARKMLEMTYDINDKYFDYTGEKRTITTPLMVTCITCHNGKPEPEAALPSKQKD